MGCLLSALPAAPPPPSPRRGVKPTTSGSSVAAGEACGDLTGTGARLESHYTTGKQIGKGHYGLVYEGVSLATGRRVAIKKIDKSLCTPYRIQEEIEILSHVGQQESIVAMIAAYDSEKTVDVVMELMEGGELYARIAAKGPYCEAKAACMTRRLADAVRYLHRHGIVHRDLKPENVLLQSAEADDVVKLADFGLAKLLVNQTHMTTVCGTWAYSAPEVRIYRQPYNYKVDIWSLGVILFTILGGYHPFDPFGNATEAELQHNVKNAKFDFDDEVWRGISSDAKDLIRGMLRNNPKERLSAKGVLAHSWLSRFAPVPEPSGEKELNSDAVLPFSPAESTRSSMCKVSPMGRSAEPLGASKRVLRPTGGGEEEVRSPAAKGNGSARLAMPALRNPPSPSPTHAIPQPVPAFTPAKVSVIDGGVVFAHTRPGVTKAPPVPAFLRAQAPRVEVTLLSDVVGPALPTQPPRLIHPELRHSGGAVRTATKKAAGSSRNGRDSNPKYLGVKLLGGEVAAPGYIILRQRGTKFHIEADGSVGMGKDHTIYSHIVGTVAFRWNPYEKRNYVRVMPAGAMELGQTDPLGPPM